ncbi:hypothetical protein AV530_008174 [Patagioenas fasciata monilis]|uniref:Uncharacterized protein n=1 Tax=Patagioenas fasciata monilis TaxID=372326 RepID=A0A1V4KUJ8_PATFA|nr:hypothetical protein AV530_008174 [Patagioenas fasciata monilis]
MGMTLLGIRGLSSSASHPTAGMGGWLEEEAGGVLLGVTRAGPRGLGTLRTAPPQRQQEPEEQKSLGKELEKKSRVRKWSCSNFLEVGLNWKNRSLFLM